MIMHLDHKLGLFFQKLDYDVKFDQNLYKTQINEGTF